MGNESEQVRDDASVESKTDNSETDTNKDKINQPVTNDDYVTNDSQGEEAKKEEQAVSTFITELGSGWYEAPGIGTFYDAGNGWIYEPNLGWSFLKVCPSNCSAWLFNENLGWLWFDSKLQNMTFVKNNNGVSSWIYYPESTLGESNIVYMYPNAINDSVSDIDYGWMQWK